jgi:hypothetical protein
MIRQQGYGHPLRKGMEYGLDETVVEVFDSLQFQGYGAVVTSLIAGFDVQIDEVISSGRAFGVAP